MNYSACLLETLNKLQIEIKKKKSLKAVLEVQLVLKVECSSLRLVQIPWHISEKVSKKTNLCSL